MRNGYSKNSKAIKVKCRLSIGKGRTEWGAVPGRDYYILNILEIRSVAAVNDRSIEADTREKVPYITNGIYIKPCPCCGIRTIDFPILEEAIKVWNNR